MSGVLGKRSIRQVCARCSSRQYAVRAGIDRVEGTSPAARRSDILATMNERHDTTRSGLVLLSPLPPPPSRVHRHQQRDTGSGFGGSNGASDFFLHRNQTPRRSDSDPNDVGRTLRVLTNSLPTLLRDGVLPGDILSESILLELLPSTLGLPEIRGRTAYGAFSRLATWSVRQLWPDARLDVVSQRLIGSARKLDRLVVKFRVMRPGDGESAGRAKASLVSNALHPGGVGDEDAYSGVFHFYFDERGLVSRHVFEITDQRWSPGEVLNWLIGRRRQTEAELGLCCRSHR